MAAYEIIHGDCLEKMNKLEPECADLVFADPPYWMRVNGSLKGWKALNMTAAMMAGITLSSR